jgi:cell volume regulation protein A
VTSQDVVETLAIVLAAGLISELVAGYLRLPPMVVLLGAGALLGPHGTEWLDLPLDAIGIELLLTIGVSVILFYGGLGLSLRVLRRVAVGLGLLTVPGVIVTALVTGAVASAAFDLPFSAGFLIGAVLAPTDPAILIPLFERLHVRPKVTQTIIAESAINDPTGAVLALALSTVVLEGDASFGDPVVEFVKDLGIATGLGVAFGLVLAAVISNRRAGVFRETPAIAVLLCVTGGYFSIDYIGGSGYLGAFIAGLIAGNLDVFGLGMHARRELEVRSFVRTVSDVMVIFVFITLGANLPFDTFGDFALPALATLAVFVVVARPLVVVACLAADRPGRWTREEIVFLAWTRETGVVPAAVAALLVAEGIPHADELVTTVALAIVVTLLVQSTTKPWLARRLGLVEVPGGKGKGKP